MPNRRFASCRRSSVWSGARRAPARTRGPASSSDRPARGQRGGSVDAGVRGVRAGAGRYRRVCEHRRARSAHALLDRLLHGFAERYDARKRAQSWAGLRGSGAALPGPLVPREELRERYRERFVHVMVDELQDTNRVQLELIELSRPATCSRSATRSSRSTASAMPTWSCSSAAASGCRRAGRARRCRRIPLAAGDPRGAQPGVRGCAGRSVPPLVAGRSGSSDPAARSGRRDAGRGQGRGLGLRRAGVAVADRGGPGARAPRRRADRRRVAPGTSSC